MGKQDPKSLLKRAKTSQGGKREDAKDGNGVAPNTGGLGEIGNDLSQEARRLLPEISQSMSLMGFNPFGDDPLGARLSFSNEIDDPQRYQFEETTFAAPNILKELAEALTRFSFSYKEYLNRTALYDPESGDPLPPERTAPCALLPGFVANMLGQEWKDVISETVYTPRAWQTSAYKAAYSTIAVAKSTAAADKMPDQVAVLRVTDTPAQAQASTTEKTAAGKSNAKVDSKSITDLLEEIKTKNQSKRDTDLADARTGANSKKKGKLSSKEPNQAGPGGPGK